MYLVVPTSTLRSQLIGLMNIGRQDAVHTTHALAQSTNFPLTKIKVGKLMPLRKEGLQRLRSSMAAPRDACLLRSTSDARWSGPTRRTPPWRSTSAGRYSARRGWTRQSTPSTYAPEAPHLDLHRRRRQSRQLFRHAL